MADAIPSRQRDGFSAWQFQVGLACERGGRLRRAPQIYDDGSPSFLADIEPDPVADAGDFPPF